MSAGRGVVAATVMLLHVALSGGPAAAQPAGNGARFVSPPPLQQPLAGWAAGNARMWLGQPSTAAPIAARAEDGFANFGTAMKYALPAAAALCAARQHRLEDFAVRGLLQAGVVWGMKQVLADAPIGRRPTGEGQGFPSGHTAAAFFGAADLSGKCWDDKPAAGAAAMTAAALTGASRIHAGEHTLPQVLTGAVIGAGFGGANFGIGREGGSFSLGMRF